MIPLIDLRSALSFDEARFSAIGPMDYCFDTIWLRARRYGEIDSITAGSYDMAAFLAIS